MADKSVFDDMFNSFFTEAAPVNSTIVKEPESNKEDSNITNQEVPIIENNSTIIKEPQTDQKDFIGTENSIDKSESKIIKANNNTFEYLETPSINPDRKLFDINTFVSELRENDAKKNKEYSLRNTNMSAYDVASGCIGNIVMKILNYPIQDYSSSWLPVKMRGHIGEGIHNFIQEESDQFTEIEASLKIPSIHFSGRLDAMIGNNNLIEIKSCTYDDYKKIIKNHQPRVNDFYQLMTYKYMLENYLEEAQRQPRENLRSDPPKQKEYNIDTLQIIFVCHQIFAADSDSVGSALAEIKKIKQLLNSKRNQFYFMTALTIDLTKLDINQYLDPIKRKIERVNHYVSLNELPDKNDEFIDTHACFFCLYGQNCPYK